MILEFRAVLILFAAVGAACACVPLVIAAAAAARKPTQMRRVASGLRAAAAVEMAEYRRQKATDDPRSADERAAARKAAAKAAFHLEAGDDAIYPTGPEGTFLLIATAIDDSRSTRRNLLWVGAGTFITAGGTVLAILGTPPL